MASAEAVERRRANRASQTASRLRREKDREQREREVAVRVARRFWGEGPVYVIVLKYHYWQARRCGWDALSAEVRGRGLDGKLREPSESPFWDWWIHLHPAQRNHMVKISGVRVRRA